MHLREAMQMISDNYKKQPDANDGQPQRLSKSLAQYQEHARNAGKEMCGNCPLFIKGGYCRFVYGQINPRGWCNLWGFSKLLKVDAKSLKLREPEVKMIHQPHGPFGPKTTM